MPSPWPGVAVAEKDGKERLRVFFSFNLTPFFNKKKKKKRD
jgi:hypothetical protein